MKKTYFIILGIIICFLAGLFLIQLTMRKADAETEDKKIALLMNGSRDDLSYCQAQYEGMRRYELGSGATVTYYDNVQPDERFTKLVKELITAGYGIIVCDSYVYEPLILELAEQYPDIYFLNATGTQSAGNYCSYLGRVYQVRYLTGIVAGKSTKTNKIGYIIASPTPETIRQANAFTIGVRKVNPDAVVYVRYTNNWNNDKIAQTVTRKLIKEQEIDVLTLQTNTIMPLKVADENGILTIGNNRDNHELFPDTYLTACVFDWSPFFADRISECNRNRLIGKHYWEGMDTGLVEMAPMTDLVDEGTKRIVEEETAKIIEGSYDIFFGPVLDAKGTERVRKGENLPDSELLTHMDWYVEGVDAK